MRRFFSICFVLLLTACSAPTPTATLPAPTQPAPATDAPEPTATAEALPSPTLEPSATPLPAPSATPEPSPVPPAVDPALTGAAWEWLDSETPGCDLLVFQQDGGLPVQSDCQAGLGSYQLSGSDLNLSLPDGLAGEFASRLAGVTAYSLKDGVLTLNGASGTGLSFAARPLLQAAAPAAGAGAASLKTNARVYLGPGTGFPVVGVLPAGSSAAVAVRIFEKPWWGISIPGLPDGLGWIQAEAADISQLDAVPYTAIEKLQVGGDALLWPELADPRASVSGEVPIYAGPSESYALLMAGMPGDTFYVLGKSEDGQYLVVFVPQAVVPSGLGWVRADSVETRNVENVPLFKAPPAPGKSRFLQPASGQAFAAAMTNVNVRGGPGVEYTVYKVTERGEIVLITGVTPDGIWYRIRVPQNISSDGIAWISAPNVRTFNAGSIPVVQYTFPMPLIRTDTLGPLCEVVSQKPREFEIFKKGIEVTFEFEIRNNTDYTWSRGDVDFVYIDNIDNWPMHTGPSRLDLEESTISGNTVIVKIEAKTPTKHNGIFGERWVVRKAGKTVCAFTYQIRTRE